jgi:hypothetical protein
VFLRVGFVMPYATPDVLLLEMVIFMPASNRSAVVGAPAGHP